MALQRHLFGLLVAPAWEIKSGVRNTKNKEHLRNYSGGGGGAGVPHPGLAGPPGPTVGAAAFRLDSAIGTIGLQSCSCSCHFLRLVLSLPFLLVFKLIFFSA